LLHIHACPIVHAAYPPMLHIHVHAAYPCPLSMLHVLVHAVLRMPVLHVHAAYTQIVSFWTTKFAVFCKRDVKYSCETWRQHNFV
jgi:hypothetical protein